MKQEETVTKAPPENLRLKRLLTSSFGLGRLPGAPGTWGSLAVAVVFVALNYADLPEFAVTGIMLALAIVGGWICVRYVPEVSAFLGKEDPSEIVADELAGQAMTFAAIGAVAREDILVAAAAGFILFRIFDILKPWPIRRLEKLPAGWGVLADDLAAGVVAGVILLGFSAAGFHEWRHMLGNAGETFNIYTAIVLGFVQGVTEFLPVSSSGHLVLFEYIFGLDQDSPPMLVFDLVVHVGTVLAILIVLRGTIVQWGRNLLRARNDYQGMMHLYRRNPSIRLLVLAMAAIVTTGVLGLAFEDYLRGARGRLGVVAIGWMVTATALLITDYRKRTRVGLRQFAIWAAVIVGAAQAIAILPGISRSGATICAAILLGLRRKWAVEFSFLMSIPLILGITLKETIENWDAVMHSGISFWVYLVGMAVATMVGVYSLKMLVVFTRGANLKYFAFYCYLLSLATAVYVLLT